MSLTPEENKAIHAKLPIGSDEEILAVFRHHPFAYIQLWIIALLLVVGIVGMTLFVTTMSISGTPLVSAQYRDVIIAIGFMLSIFVAAATYIPIWLRMHEQLVLTDEAVLQILRPSLFSDKISQLGLQHVADVTVRQDMLGNMFGYGKITIETPGEQDDYEYYYLPKPQDAARQIVEAHESFSAALESGRVETNYRHGSAQAIPPTPQQTLDAQQYQEFLQFEEMKRQQAQAAQPQGEQDTPTPPQDEQS